MDATGGKALNLRLTDGAGKRLHMISSENIGSLMSVYYHNKYISQATIQGPIGKDTLITIPSAHTQR